MFPHVPGSSRHSRVTIATGDPGAITDHCDGRSLRKPGARRAFGSGWLADLAVAHGCRGTVVIALCYLSVCAAVAVLSEVSVLSVL